MKDWSGKNLCFECAKRLGARINIGRKLKGRCHRCHSEQTLYTVTEVPVTPVPAEGICPDCAHPAGTHATSCRRSEVEVLRREREEVIAVLKEFEGFDPERPLAEQLRRILGQRALKENHDQGRTDKGEERDGARKPSQRG